MAGRSGRRLGLAVAAAVLGCLVLVAVLTDEGGSSRSRKHRGAAEPGTPSPARSQRPAGQKRVPAPGAVGRSQARGGDEGEPEWSVYVVSARGGSPKLAARTPSEVPVTPAWSRRNGLIAYARPGCDECDAAVWLTSRDGAARGKLANHVGNLTDPAWSPDGRRVAAVRVGGGLYSLPVRDGVSRPLLRGAVVEDPDWSPHGGAIAFARRRGASGWDIFTIAPSGHRLHRLTSTAAQELAPDWSPGGGRLAFQRQDRSGAWSVYVMYADGSRVRRLIAGSPKRSVVQPAWSPDGRSIAYVAVTLRSTRIEVLRLAGDRTPRTVTDSGLEASDPDWSPDGRLIAFSGKRGKE